MAVLLKWLKQVIGQVCQANKFMAWLRFFNLKCMYCDTPRVGVTEA